jgi:anti-anti-sigma factor
LKVKEREEGSVVVVSVDSSVLQEHIPIFRERLNDIIAQKKCWIVFDLFEASYVSSIGISVLLEIKKKANDSGGEVVFANVNHLIMNLFKVTELLKTLEVYDSVEEAVEALKKKMA